MHRFFSCFNFFVYHKLGTVLHEEMIMGVPIIAWLAILSFALAYFAPQIEIRVIASIIGVLFGGIAALYYARNWGQPAPNDE